MASTRDEGGEVVTGTFEATGTITAGQVIKAAGASGMQLQDDGANNAIDIDDGGGVNLLGPVVVNEAGADKDVRMEGDTEINLFFLDASTDRIGFGIATPAYLVESNRAGDGTNTVQMSGSAAGAGNTLRVVRNRSAANTDSPVADMIQDAATDDQAVLRLQQDGTGAILLLFDAGVQVFSVADGGQVDIVGDLTLSGTGLLPSNLSPTDDITASFGGTGLYSVPGGFFVRSGALSVVQPTAGAIVFELSTTAGGTNRPTRQTIQNRVATTGSTVTTLHTFTIAANTVYGFEIKVLARRTGGVSGAAEDCAYYTHSTLVRNSVGSAAFVGTTTTVIKEVVAGYDCILDVTGATMRVRVTGVATTNITWDMHADVVVLSS